MDALLIILLISMYVHHILCTPPHLIHGPQQFLPALAEFRALKFLGIMDLRALNVGFHPPGCGNAYRGPGGRELRERVSRQAKDLREAVTAAAFSACKHLEEVWIGSGSKARVERQDGAVKDIEYFSV
jgi:hypothetical protein